MKRYADNPFKSGVDSIVSSLTLFDCEGNELKGVTTDNTDARITFQLPLTSDQSQVSLLVGTTDIVTGCEPVDDMR